MNLGSKLDWSEDFDGEDNSMWEAWGPYTDEDGSSEFSWRLKQRLARNVIEWYEDSDPELMADEECPRTWATIEEAKEQIEKDHAEILESEKTKE